jgi:hypothetical protein
MSRRAAARRKRPRHESDACERWRPSRHSADEMDRRSDSQKSDTRHYVAVSIGPGNGVFSQSVVVDVENPTPLTGLDVTPPRINFRHVGDRVNLTAIGTFGDGTESDITHSSNTSYQTNDATVATVGTDGVVTATGIGTTGILVKYGGQLVPVPVSVTETFAGKPGSPNCHGDSVSALAQRYGGLAAAAKALGYSSVQALQDAIRAFCGG